MIADQAYQEIVLEWLDVIPNVGSAKVPGGETSLRRHDLSLPPSRLRSI